MMGKGQHNGKFETCRPKTLDDMIGQRQVTDKLKQVVQVYRASGIKPPHILMTGPSGTGKTTASNAVANALNWKLARLDSGVKLCDLRMFLYELDPNTVLFIDEAHELSKKCEALLLTAAVEWMVPVSVDKQSPDTVSLPPFTMVLATTNPEQIFKPLRNRCRTACEFSLFNLDEMKQIVARAAKLYGLKISAPGIAALAEASGCTARGAEQLLQGVRDSAIVEGTNGKVLGKAFVQKSLQVDGTDQKGCAQLIGSYWKCMPKRIPTQCSCRRQQASLIFIPTQYAANTNRNCEVSVLS